MLRLTKKCPKCKKFKSVEWVAIMTSHTHLSGSLYCWNCHIYITEDGKEDTELMEIMLEVLADETPKPESCNGCIWENSLITKHPCTKCIRNPTSDDERDAYTPAPYVPLPPAPLSVRIKHRILDAILETKFWIKRNITRRN